MTESVFAFYESNNIRLLQEEQTKIKLHHQHGADIIKILFVKLWKCPATGRLQAAEGIFLPGEKS